MNEQSWLRLMRQLSFDDNLSTFEKLCSAYAEGHRYYHTAVHIDSCLNLFEEFSYMANGPAAVECAIWFHDAIYNPMSKDNELKSANWAEQFLKANASTEQINDQVRNLIIATIHDAPASDPDSQLLVDIDLAILGADEKTYSEFEVNVRREYNWVPGPLFRRARRRILQSFVDRTTIYSTDPFRNRFETRARNNIARVLRTI